MLKYKLSEDEFAKIDEGLQSQYKQQGDSFVLQLDGDDGDVGGLKAQNEKLLGELKEMKKSIREAEEAAAEQLREAKRKATEAEQDKARKSGDLEAIEKGYKEQITALQNELEKERKTSSEREVKRVASEIAGELSQGANREILQRFVQDRLRFEDGDVKVCDESGNLTISTRQQLTEEFRASDRYAALVTGSQGSGGGAPSQDGKNGTGGAKTVARSQFDQWNDAQRRDFAVEGGKVVAD